MRTSGAEGISTITEEFGSYEYVCLVTTNRTHPDIHGFHRAGVPTLSKGGARDAFYDCNLDKPSAADDLIPKLDF